MAVLAVDLRDGNGCLALLNIIRFIHQRRLRSRLLERLVAFYPRRKIAEEGSDGNQYHQNENPASSNHCNNGRREGANLCRHID